MEEWRKCTNCKKTIPFRVKYWICNVSTCQKKRAGLIFCSTECWDAHLPILRHKEAWAIERIAPSTGEWAEVLAGTRDDPTYPPRPKAEKIEEEVAPKKTSSAPPIIRRRS